MERYPHLQQAPIVEALIDFRISKSVSTTLDCLSEIGSRIAHDYPTRRVVRKVETNIRIHEDDTTSSGATELVGYQYVSRDGKYVFGAALDGFTLSRLQPYETWEQLKTESIRLWRIYREIAQPASISRVALRYINRLNLPMTLRDFQDYLTTAPHPPPRMPQTLLGFLTQIVVPLERTQAVAIITQKTDPVTEGDVFPVILDIDVSKAGEFLADGDEAWEIAETLRTEKNRIFFESISEDMEERCR